MSFPTRCVKSRCFCPSVIAVRTSFPEVGLPLRPCLQAPAPQLGDPRSQSLQRPLRTEIRLSLRESTPSRVVRQSAHGRFGQRGRPPEPSQPLPTYTPVQDTALPDRRTNSTLPTWTRLLRTQLPSPRACRRSTLAWRPWP